MNKLVDALSWVAMRCTQNKYLNAIKNTFQNYMPISLTGAVGIFWINVLVNDRGGLGAVFPLIMETSVYKGYKQDKIEMRGDRAEMSDFPLYLNTVAGGLDRRDQTIGGFSFVVKIYAVPVVEIIG